MRRLSAVCAVLGIGACGGPQEAGGAGAECYRDDDCEYGLVCAVPAGGNARVCTDDVSALISEVQPPTGAGTAGASTAGSGAGD